MRTEELARKLIEVETETPVRDEEKFGPVASFLSESGFDHQIHSFDGVKNLSASHGSGSPHVCLAGHLDVVPAGSGWSESEPFEPEIRDGILYGRGASDMKGGLAAQLLAFRDLAESRDFHGSVTLLVTGDEEQGGRNGAARILEEVDGFDLALIAEPTDMKLQTGFRGKIHLDVILEGEGGHASRPESADNIIERLPDVIESLGDLDWEDDGTGLPGTTSVITQLETDNPKNSIPGSVRLGIDIRNDTRQDFESVKRKLESKIPGDIEFSVELDHRKPEVLVENEELIEAARSAFRSVRAEEAVLTTEGGSSDGAHFARQGVPSLEIGPQQSQIHAPDEYASVQNLRDIRSIFRRICLVLSD